MEAHRHFGKARLGGRSQGLPSRRNSILVAVLSAVLAAVLIYLFVSHYDNGTVQQLAPVEQTVWVATHPIPQGTPEAAIVGEGYIKAKQIPVGQVAVGAIDDPSQVLNEAATAPIAVGQQITASDFTRSQAVISGLLKGDERGVAFSLDSEHGITSYLASGDTVDVMGVSEKTGTSELLVQDVPVLANSAGIVVLRLTDRQALLVTAATANYSLWLSLRPSLDAKNSVKVYSVGS